jgi:hypothetical protein
MSVYYNEYLNCAIQILQLVLVYYLAFCNVFFLYSINDDYNKGRI